MHEAQNFVGEGDPLIQGSSPSPYGAQNTTPQVPNAFIVVITISARLRKNCVLFDFLLKKPDDGHEITLFFPEATVVVTKRILLVGTC